MVLRELVQEGLTAFFLNSLLNIQDKTKIHLTAPEMACLWTQYVNDSLAVCVQSYFLEKVEDEEVRPMIEWTLDTAEENISIMQELFEKEDFPLPIGFTEQDVYYVSCFSHD